jgi:hypothetical protein
MELAAGGPPGERLSCQGFGKRRWCEPTNPPGRGRAARSARVEGRQVNWPLTCHPSSDLSGRAFVGMNPSPRPGRLLIASALGDRMRVGSASALTLTERPV